MERKITVKVQIVQGHSLRPNKEASDPNFLRDQAGKMNVRNGSVLGLRGQFRGERECSFHFHHPTKEFTFKNGNSIVLPNTVPLRLETGAR